MNYKRIESFVYREGVAEVQTVAGKLRGFLEDGVYNFRGVEYAQAERFREPKPVTPWEGVKPAVDYGCICTQLNPPSPMGDIMNPHRFWATSEHCQNLNIWTTSLDPNAKKPVMVWLHGGGYVGGSAIEMICYDGTNQARYGDVVSVTVNHRLGVLGFLDLSMYGEEYQASGNLGIIDIRAALQWVHENIAQFGGDPDNVTIYGQSGGGGKVTTLMQMSSADGLYHRAIVESGIIHLEGPANTPMRITKEAAVENTRQLMEHVGSLDALLSMPEEQLMQEVRDTFRNTMFWTPVPGAGDYPGDQAQAGFRKESLQIPVMIGCSLCEFAFNANAKDKSALTEDEIMAEMTAKYGDRAETILSAFKQSYPEVNPYYAVTSIPMAFRPDVIGFCEKRAAAGGGPTYQYVLAYESAINGGTMSWHCAEIPFIFHNADFTASVFNGEKTWKMQEQLFGSWMSFARSGDPNNAHIPEWRPYQPDDHACFVFDDCSGTRVDHDAAMLALL